METDLSSSLSGKIGELIAITKLTLNGYKIVSHNYITGKKTGAGEIDIIAQKNNLLAFIEVKKRRTIESASYSISAKQMSRITRGAEAFLKNNPQYRDFNIRFDAVLISKNLKFEHIIDAWRPEA